MAGVKYTDEEIEFMLECMDTWYSDCVYSGTPRKEIQLYNQIKNKGYKFVGRSRSTEPGNPQAVRERRVQDPNGQIEWAEVGSIMWERAAANA